MQTDARPPGGDTRAAPHPQPLVSPWRPLPPCCAAAWPPPPAGVALGARPAPFRRGLRPRPRLAGFARLLQAPPSLSSRSRRQSLEKWNLAAAAAPCAGLAEPHWACSVAGASAALSRKLACCSPQLIRVLSGLRDLGAGSGADRTPCSAGEPRFLPCLQPGDLGDGPECAAGAGQPASLAACALGGCCSFSGGHRRSPSCSSCRRICSGRPLRSPARPAPAPQGRRSGCGLAPSLPLLSQSHPELGLGRAERGHRVAGLCPGGDCGGQSAGGRGRPVAHAPLPRGRPARPAARSCGRLRDLASVSRGVESPATQREGGKVPVPSAMLRAF